MSFLLAGRTDIGGRILRVSPDGMITTVAGNGTRGFSGDDGPATAAELNSPTGVAADGAGNLFIADHNRIRKVSASGVIATAAGNGAPGVFFFGDGGQATAAVLDVPTGVALDANGNLFIADFGNYRVRRVSPNGIITTVAGNGAPGFSSDEGPATSAALITPSSLAVDAAGNVYVVEIYSSVVRIPGPTKDTLLIGAVGRCREPRRRSGFAGQDRGDLRCRPRSARARPESAVSLHATVEGQITPAGVDGGFSVVDCPGNVVPGEELGSGIPTPERTLL
jgi:hypothetical protein